MRVSCLVDDCLKRGKSVDEGGAVYNNIQPNFLGLANVADSLVVLNELVFRAKEYTLEEFTEILDNNFEGQEDLRERILKKIPHYGTNNAEADAMVQQVLNAIEDACKVHGTDCDALVSKINEYLAAMEKGGSAYSGFEDFKSIAMISALGGVAEFICIVIDNTTKPIGNT